MCLERPSEDVDQAEGSVAQPLLDVPSFLSRLSCLLQLVNVVRADGAGKHLFLILRGKSITVKHSFGNSVG